MLKINATPKEFDDFWNNNIQSKFNIFEKEIDKLDLSGKTIDTIKSSFIEMQNAIYKELDNVFTNQWKYFCRDEKVNE